jgi:REP-associated tyrosine transposase
MSRFSTLSHVIWHCQYHIVWVSTYRYNVLKGKVGFEVSNSIRVYCGRLGCEVVEISVQPDHVHVIVKIPPKISISQFNGNDKRENSVTSIQKVSVSKRKALLGQSLLGEGLLCGNSGGQCADDTKVCKISRG